MNFTPGTTDRIEHSFSILDDIYDTNKIKRTKLLDKLMAVVDITDIDPKTDSARTIETKLQIFNTTAGLLNDDDKQINNHVKLGLAKKSDEQLNQVAKNVVELLKNIRVVDDGQPSVVIPMESCDAEIDDVFSEKDDIILETELKIDSDDYS